MAEAVLNGVPAKPATFSAHVVAAVAANYGRSVSNPVAEEALFACLPDDPAAASDIAWINWARRGGYLAALDAWLAADVHTPDKSPSPIALVNLVGAAVDAIPTPTRADLVAASLVALDQIEKHVDDLRGPEPDHKVTDRFEEWYGHQPDDEQVYREFEKAGGREGTAQTLAHYRWTKQGDQLRRSWRNALLALGQVLENPGAATAKTDLAIRRKAELNQKLARYPRHLTSVNAQGLECLKPYLLCDQDELAVGLRDKVLTETLRTVYDHPEARPILDVVLDYKHSPQTTELDLMTTKNNRARAKIHELIRDVGGLYSQSREEGKRAYQSRYDQGPVKTIVISKTPFEEPVEPAVEQ